MLFKNSKNELITIIGRLTNLLNKYEKYLDIIYLFLYLTIFSVSTLSLMGFQDIVSYTIPQWDMYYYFSNIIMVFLSSGAIALLLSQRKDYGLVYIAFLALFFGLWAFLEAYILLFHSIGYGIIYRMSFNIIMTILLIARFFFIKLILKVEEVLNE